MKPSLSTEISIGLFSFWMAVLSEKAGRLTGKPRTMELFIRVANSSRIIRKIVSSIGVKSAVVGCLVSDVSPKSDIIDVVAVLNSTDYPSHF